MIADGGWLLGSQPGAPEKQSEEQFGVNVTENTSNEPIEFFDPHFHVWDINKKGPHDGDILFEPHGDKLYDT